MVKPHLLTVSKEHRIVVASEKCPQNTVIIGAKGKNLLVLLKNGTEITIDRRGNTTTFTPMLSEVF